MASQRDQQLRKVGLEGFGLIDEFYGRNRRLNQNQQRLQSPQPQVHQSQYQYSYYQHQPSYVCQPPQVYTVTKESVTNYQGTSQHQFSNGGRSTISEGHRISIAKEPVISSKEAAQLYGGKMIIDYSKPLRRPYY